jgi:hypothetical protein
MTTRFLPSCLGAGLLFATLALATTGCSSEKQTGTVSGTVKYHGKTLNTGSVNFLSTSGSAGQGVIDENGNYKVEGPLEVGEYKVYLAAPVPGQHAPGVKVPKAPRFEVIPKYLQPESSGLTFTVKAGANEYPIDIK